MTQAMEAYHEVVVSDQYEELERLRDKARIDEAYILRAVGLKNLEIGIEIGIKRGIEKAKNKWKDLLTNSINSCEDSDPEKAELQTLLGCSFFSAEINFHYSLVLVALLHSKAHFQPLL